LVGEDFFEVFLKHVDVDYVQIWSNVPQHHHDDEDSDRASVLPEPNDEASNGEEQPTELKVFFIVPEVRIHSTFGAFDVSDSH
jgi:hypothetical protein